MNSLTLTNPNNAWDYSSWGVWDNAHMNYMSETPHAKPSALVIALKNIGMWHYVSKAVHFRCVSSDDHNDGYWEVVRVPISEIGEAFHMKFPILQMKEDPNSNATPKVRLVDTDVKEFPIIFVVDKDKSLDIYNGMHWVNNPTYQTGSIKAVSQFEFRLYPQKINHDFISMPECLTVGTANYDEYGDSTSHDNYPLWKWAYDSQFDVILIRFVGVPETNIMVHLVCNVEIIPTPLSTYTQFQTECCSMLGGLKKHLSKFKLEE
jgi:hypothetical protein